MKVGLDLDNTLLCYEEYMKVNAPIWLAQHGVIPMGADDTAYDDYKFFGVAKNIWNYLMRHYGHEVMKGYIDAGAPDESLEFLTNLKDEGFEVSFITHRANYLRDDTVHQIKKAFDVLGDVPVYFAEGDKSVVMIYEKIPCLLDDSPAVITDVLRYSGLTILAPKKRYNQGYPAVYYDSFKEALKILRNIRAMKEG